MLAMRIISTVILGLMLFLFSGMFILSSEEDDPIIKVVASIFILAVIFVIVTVWIV